MAIITRNPTLARFEWSGSFSERTLPKSNKWRWCPQGRVWWTDDIRQVRPLAEYASDQVITFLEKLDSKIQASYATELTGESPLMADKIRAFGAHRGLELFPFQQAGVSYILKAKHCMIGDDMGLGKTMQAIAAASLSDCPHIYVCCPKAVATNWAAKIADWTGGRAEILKGIKPGKPSQSKWVIVPYPIVANRWQELDNSGAFVICDEVHYLKNPKAKRTIAILGGWNAKVRQPVKGLATKACYFVGLTGTPMPNRPP